MSIDRSIGVLFANQTLVPYYSDTFALVCLIFSTVLVTFGIFVVILLLIILSKQFQSSSTILILYLGISNLLYQLCRATSGISVFLLQGWTKRLCIWGGFFSIFSSGEIYMSLQLIALEGYLKICHGYHISPTVTYVALFCANTMILAISTVTLLFPDTALQLVPSGSYCIATFYSHNMAPFIVSITAITVLVSTNFILIYCYSSIFFKYYFRKKVESDIVENIIQPKTWNVAISTSEKIVFKKCAFLSLSFIILWGFELVCIIVEFVRKEPLPPFYSALAAVLAGTHTFIEPMLIVHFDAKLKKEIYELFGVTQRKSSIRSEIAGDRLGRNLDIRSPRVMSTVIIERYK